MFLILSLFCLATFLILVIVLRTKTTWGQSSRNRRQQIGPGKVLGFFHPHASNGGGGERVLWMMLRAILTDDAFRGVQCVIYHSNPLPPSTSVLFDLVHQQFGIEIPPEARKNLHLIGIDGVEIVEPSRYPRLTMLLQGVGSARLGWRCLRTLTPDYFIDTTGFPFSYPLAKLVGCTVITYTHYPTISTDMLRRVQSRDVSTNNNATVSGSSFRTNLKIVYYWMFALLYHICGRCVTCVMANSSWTTAHMEFLWRKVVHRVYPPCPVGHLNVLPLVPRRRQILSVGQFRPEKDHPLQLKVFRRIVKEFPDVQLVLVGGVRNQADRDRVAGLQASAKDIPNIHWEVNCPYPRLLELLQESLIGLHCMRDEHFGISVVEYMAAGCVVVAHNSAGPKMDIVVPSPDAGFLADSEDSYVDALRNVLRMTPKEIECIQTCARGRCSKFSNEAFDVAVRQVLQNVIQK